MMKKYIKKNINTSTVLLLFLLLATLPGAGCGKIQDYTFLNFVPQTTLRSLGTDNVDEILESVRLILKKQTKDLDVKEALLAKAYYEHQKDTDMIIKCSERVLLLCSDQDISQDVTLQLAQIYLDQADFDKAVKYSKDYQEFYPGNVNAKKAAYIDIQAHYLSILQSGRDQKKTEETIELANLFLDKYKEQDNYSMTINQIISTCYNNLFDTEISVINTYLDKYNYYNNFSSLNAATRRLAYVKTKVLPFIKNSEKEKNVANLELTMTKALNKFNYDNNKQEVAA